MVTNKLHFNVHICESWLRNAAMMINKASGSLFYTHELYVRQCRGGEKKTIYANCSMYENARAPLNSIE